MILKYFYKNYFAPLRILNLSIKHFVNLFVDIALTCSFNSFLFDVISFSLLPKSVLFTELAISFLLANFALFNHKSNISAVNLLNSEVVKYLS